MKTLITLVVSALLLMACSASLFGYEWTTREGQLNINTATLEELQNLPGISEATARSIMDFRSANGPFSTFTDLIKVRGVSYRMIDDMRPYIKMEGASDLTVEHHVMPDN